MTVPSVAPEVTGSVINVGWMPTGPASVRVVNGPANDGRPLATELRTPGVCTMTVPTLAPLVGGTVTVTAGKLGSPTPVIVT